VPVAPVNTPADLLDDPQLIASGQFMKIEADGRTMQLPVLPFRSNRYDPPTSGHIPALGEHTREIVEQYTSGPANAEPNL
jgi:crotonobetainyl-CoA:carnitine CoA-transferase CaiB-like acyl-CoA transferase